MANNTDLNPGSGGDTIRDIQKSGGAKTQVILIDVGGSGAESLVGDGAGLPVAQSGSWTVAVTGTVAATQSGTWTVGITGTVTVSGTVAATQSGSWTVTANAGTNLNTSMLALESGGNLATIAGIVTSSRAAINPISGQAGVDGGSGTASASTQRVCLATNVALPAGSNALGTVGVTTQVGAANGFTNQAALTSTPAAIAAARPTRRNITIVNLGSNDVYLGFTNAVNGTTGQLLLGTKGAAVTLGVNCAVYGYAATNQSVSFSEEYD